jgi:ribosomal protein S18 acetylase RimI-like enzyme
MDHENLTIDGNPDETEIEFVKNGLKEFNDAIVGDDDHRLVNFVVKNERNEIVAGLIGGTYWGWLYVDRFWIREEYRKRGLGKKLLAMAEKEAIKRGCEFAHLDTMSFQALGFYQKQGYEVRCELKDLPRGHSKYLLVKRLNKDPAAR